MINDSEQANFETFRDCLSDALIQRLSAPEAKPKTKKTRETKSRRKSANRKELAVGSSSNGALGNDAEELGEFIEYLASEIFPSLPTDLRTLSFSAVQNNVVLASKYSLPLSRSTSEELSTHIMPSAIDSLSTYLSVDPSAFLLKPLEAYIASITAPPPIYSTTKTTECELCLRDWIPLTYHHLIPRSVHAKALKRGWCEEWEINKVAWLCRSCHSMCHRVCTNEELAKDFDSVEKLMEREDVRAFVGWVGRVRWTSR